MRLEPLCRLSMRYVGSAWARPYGGEEGAGFGTGDGSVSGDVLRGTLPLGQLPTPPKGRRVDAERARGDRHRRRNARSQGYDWARIGRLLGRSRQSVRKRYGEIDGTYEPIQFDALDLAAKLMADHKRGLAERERRRRFEAWAASDDVVAW